MVLSSKMYLWIYLPPLYKLDDVCEGLKLVKSCIQRHSFEVLSLSSLNQPVSSIAVSHRVPKQLAISSSEMFQLQ